MPFLRSLLRFGEPLKGATTPFRAVDVAAIDERTEAIRACGWDVSEESLSELPTTQRWNETVDLVLAFTNADLAHCAAEQTQSLIEFSRLALRQGGFLMVQLTKDAPLSANGFISLCRDRGFPAVWRASPLFPADPFLGEHSGPTDLVIARQDVS